MIQELRFALRAWLRSPGLTLVAVLILALGIGATSAIFSVVQAVLLKALPFRDAERLVSIHHHPRGKSEPLFEMSYPDWKEYRRWSERFAGIAGVASSDGGVVLTYDDRAERVGGYFVTGNFFEVLGIAPLLGRLLSEADDDPGAGRVVVLAEDLWRRSLGADPEIVGQRLVVGGTPHTVVGVVADGFDYPVGSKLWVPIGPAVGKALVENRQIRFLNPLGRMEEGVSLEQAGEEIAALAERVTNAQEPEGRRVGTLLVPFKETLLGESGRRLGLFTAAAFLVLLIACANVANLLLVRATARQGEIALRGALGANRGRLVRQSLVESAVLALFGGALGLALAAWSVRTFVTLGPHSFFRREGIALDAGSLLFTLGATAFTVAVFGLAPAFLGARQGLSGALLAGGGRGGSAGGLGRRLMQGFVVLQVLLAQVLLVSAALLLQSFLRLGQVDPGFDRDRVVTMTMPLESEKFAEPSAAQQFFEDLSERVTATAGVESAAGVLLRPLQSTNGYDYFFTVEGQSADEQQKNPMVNYEAVTPRYFEVMDLPILEGRGLGPEDRADTVPVVVVSQALAEAVWGEESPLGRRLKWGPPESAAPWVTVVGVVGDARYRSLRSVSKNAYVPFRQSNWRLGYFAVRSAGAAPASLLPQIRREIAALDPAVQPVEVATTEELIASNMAGARFNARLIGLFAAVALALSAVGIYGVLAYTTARRTREFGIRMAMGSTAGGVRLLAVRTALWMAAAGVLGGLVLGVGTSRLLASQLFEVSPLDPFVYVVSALFLLAVALAAGWLPARRASRIVPSEALRGE